MNLAEMTVVLRPRSPWEGIDLGFAMARTWFLPLWRLWWATALPLFLLVVLVFPGNLWLVMVLAWWLKPVYEPPLVIWLSRALFNERPTVGEIARHWRAMLGMPLLANLTWRRLSPQRSFYMPLALLEDLPARQRRERIAVIGRGQHAGAWLTLVGVHFEIALEISMLVLLVVMLPEQLRWIDLESLLFTPNRLGEWLQQFAGLLAMSLIAPFYVAAGFALYLTRRTELEAWDIELSFRRLAGRMQRRSAPRVGTAAALACALGLVLLPSDGAAQGLQYDPVQARQTIAEVLADSDFGTLREMVYWRYTGEEPAADEENAAGWLDFLLALVRGFNWGIAPVAEVLLWTLLGLGIAYLVFRWFAERQRFPRPRSPSRRTAPAFVERIAADQGPDELPPDVAGAALGLLAEDCARAALSLLYRASLVRFLDDFALAVPRSATEGECLRLVEARVPGPDAQWFRRLTALWQRLAYGHRPPPKHAIAELCRGWQDLYQAQHEK